MNRSRRWTVALALAGVLALATASPALAIFPSLQTTLSGPAIGGVVPQGDAKVDQSKLPSQPATLDARVKNVNRPDGTVLTVVLTDCSSAPEMRITLSRGEGQLHATLPLGCQIGRTSSILVNEGATTLLSGGSPWQV
ncbi:MAG TPA: hypothetical protein VG370_10495 [Chloroflexota bacterium]|jgi:hypothetical protein|nr:hypothetical protein [Chloroflexota bacterium]